MYSDPSGMSVWSALGHALDWFNEHLNPGYAYLNSCFGSDGTQSLGSWAGHCALASTSLATTAVGIGKLTGIGAATDEAAAASEESAIKAGSAGGETAGKPFPNAIRQAALEENPDTCVYCQMSTEAPQVDHAIPRALGGDATLENAQTTCAWCNASKGARAFPVNPPPGFEGPWPPSWWGI